MQDPVNLINLREMTDGDDEMEKELFKEFFSSFENGLSILKASTDDSASEIWRKNVHALKGISLNLGAEKLGELCKKSQESHTESQAIKENLLGEIRQEYDLVNQFLKKIIPT